MSNSNDVNEILEVTCQVLITCFVMVIFVLIFWWGALGLMGDLAYSVHSKFAPISRQQFDIIQYAGLLMTKAAIFILFLLPYIAIRLMIRKRIT